MATKETLIIKGVPSDLGANTGGSNMGPAALRLASLKSLVESMGFDVRDLGDINVPVRDQLAESTKAEHYLSPIVAMCQQLAGESYTALKSGHRFLALGGDHSLAIGSISGVSRFYKETNKKLGVIWVDAHADINSPDSSLSGNIHGMPLATLLNQGHPQLTSIGYNGAKVDANLVALIGIRTLDQREKEILKESGISYYSMRNIDERGMYEVMLEVLRDVCAEADGIHLSFDLDGVDPLFAPGVSTPSPGGLSFREAHLLLEMLAETDKLRSMEFVELNPYTDQSGRSANLAVDLILSALGKTIL